MLSLIRSNHKGFSLIQILLIAAAMAGGALVMTKVMTDQKVVQKSTEVSNDLETIHSLIETTLMDRENCTATIEDILIGQPLPANNPAADCDQPPPNGCIRVPYIFVSNTVGNPTTLVGIGENASKKRMTRNFIKIMNMNIRLVPLASPRSYAFEVRYSKFNSAEGQVRGKGGKDIKKFIPITLLLDSDDNVSGCFGGDSTQVLTVAEELCGSFGPMFSWDGANSSCNFIGTTPNLPAHQYLVGYDPSGSPIPENLVPISFKTNPPNPCVINSTTDTYIWLRPVAPNSPQVEVVCSN